jgi:ABC-type bacteriocin/lantibiotic exporter with double-glycine peptidase domain
LSTPRKAVQSAIALFVVSLGTGCAYTGTAKSFNPADLNGDDRWIAVADVPLVQQKTREDCGAAALAMLLAYWREPTTLEAVSAHCPSVADHGIKAGALREYARSHGLQAYLFHGDVEDLERELTRRRPVLVGVARKYVDGVYTHYEVVVAVHPENRIIVTLDPARGWQQDTFDGFLSEWKPVGKPTLVVFRGDAAPAPEQSASP